MGTLVRCPSSFSNTPLVVGSGEELVRLVVPVLQDSGSGMGQDTGYRVNWAFCVQVSAERIYVPWYVQAGVCCVLRFSYTTTHNPEICGEGKVVWRAREQEGRKGHKKQGSPGSLMRELFSRSSSLVIPDTGDTTGAPVICSSVRQRGRSDPFSSICCIEAHEAYLDTSTFAIPPGLRPYC